MKVIIQRVTQASVKVKEELINSIGRGLVLLVGISRDDQKEDIDYIVRKVLNIKFFDDETGKRWSKSVVDKQFDVLCVSQFTLFYTVKGTKLDFHHAMKAENSEKFYKIFLDSMRSQYKPEKIKDGKFGANMQVELINDGPVTIHLESPKKGEENAEETAK